VRKETIQNKLAELLGLTEFVVEVDKKGKPKPKTNAPIGVSEDEIQNFRAAQGLTYFLQAPELFSAKTCPHCGEGFLVSRKYVAFCSYTCIEKDLEAKGIKWSRKGDIDSLIKDVYEGNEPIWIKNLEALQEVISSVVQLRQRDDSPFELQA
jgi:hypothetical protein